MIVIAHVAGVPVEELLPTVAGAGSMLLLARAWVAIKFRRLRDQPPAAVDDRRGA